MLYTASFYTPEDWKGLVYRVSRGHPRGQKVRWQTLPFLYPPRELLQAYRAGQLDFPAFEAAYRRSLDLAGEELDEFAAWLRTAPSLGDFTLLCFERLPAPCHRRTLAHWLLERVPALSPGQLR